MNSKESVCICGSRHFDKRHVYQAPPQGEINFHLAPANGYRREILQCNRCGHFLSVHAYDLKDLYAGQYVMSNYGEDGIKKAFDRINALPPEGSDNLGRVEKVQGVAAKNFSGRPPHEKPLRILDIGSGLCVFLNQMKRMGWDCTAIDPDPRATSHAEKNVGIKAITGDFLQIKIQDTFDVITFNKVLEHVLEPDVMLKKAAELLRDHGFVYVEVPDGECAQRDPLAFNREEFFIDHYHIFSAASLEILSQQSGFDVDEIERLREPSSKYTLRAILSTRKDK